MTKPHHDHDIPIEIDISLQQDTPNWDGSALTLKVSDTAMIPITPTGTMLLAWLNTSRNSNMGELSISSGGSVPIGYPTPALLNSPQLLMKNWGGNNLAVSNSSYPGSNNPIWICAYGPGLTTDFSPLPSNGTPVVLTMLQAAQGNGSSTNMQLSMINNQGTLAVVAIIGGPVGPDGSNGYVIALNADANTGPGTPLPAPAGYYATTTGNSYVFFLKNWGASTIFVAGMSPRTTLNVTVALRSL